MLDWNQQSVTALIDILLVLGIVSALAARWSAGSACQRFWQPAYCLLLVAVGGATVFAVGIAPGIWLAAASTFCVMVLAAVWDMNPRRAMSGF